MVPQEWHRTQAGETATGIVAPAHWPNNHPCKTRTISPLAQASAPGRAGGVHDRTEHDHQLSLADTD